MIAKCQIDNITKMDDNKLREHLSQWIRIDGPISSLSVGELYPIIGIIRYADGGTWIYVHSIEEVGYPYPYPIELFEIVDESIPPNWAMKFGSEEGGVVIEQAGFAEWISDEAFYEKLVDGDQTTLRLYKYQRLLLEVWSEVGCTLIGKKTKFLITNEYRSDSGDCLEYSESGYSFSTHSCAHREHHGTLCLNTLQIDVTYERELLSVWGYCPLTACRPSTNNWPQGYRSRRLVAKLSRELIPGVCQPLNDEEWEVFINRERGWVCIGDPEIEGRDLIHFAPGSVAALRSGEIVALWLHPNELPQSVHSKE